MTTPEPRGRKSLSWKKYSGEKEIYTQTSSLELPETAHVQSYTRLCRTFREGYLTVLQSVDIVVQFNVTFLKGKISRINQKCNYLLPAKTQNTRRY